MKRLFIFVLLSAAAAFGQAANCSGNLTLGPCTVTPVGIAVTLTPSALAIGQTSVASAQIQVSGGVLNAVITNQCTWASDTTSVATVAGNIVTGVAGGTANISCTAGGLSGSAPISVSAPPVITNPVATGCATPCPLPAATQNTVYSFTFAATGGTLPYTWTNSVGAPPTGLSLATSGVLSGTPSGTGTTTWTIQVADSAAHSVTLQVSLNVTAVAGCGTPPNYCARTDTVASSGSGVNSGNPPAALMGLNCATPGSCGASDCVIDDNNSGPAAAYLCRVTDYTMEGASNFVTDTSSSTTRQWSNDSSIFLGIYSVGSASAFFKYTEGTPPTIVPKGNATQDKNGMDFGAGFNWSGQPCSVATCGTSAATSYLFYGMGSNPSSFPTRQTLNKYVLDTTNAAWASSTGLGQNLAAAITGTVLSDPFTWTGLTAYMTGQDGPFWNRWMAANASDQNADKLDAWSCGDYRYAQDFGSMIVCFNLSTNAYRWIDVKTGQACGSTGTPCGAVTGFGPLPIPTGQSYTWNTTGGSLPCSNNTIYVMGMTYTVLGANGTGGESLLKATNVPATGGSGSTCSITVTPPTANPGAGSGINGPLTATGYNNYFVCSYVSGGANCAIFNPTPVMLPISTSPAQPSIASVTGCTTGAASNTVTYWAVIRSGSGSTSSASITSQPSSLTVTSNVAPGCTVTLSSPVPTGMTADILRDDLSIRGCTIAAGGTSCRDNTQNPTPYANQTVPIGSSSTLTTVTATSTASPAINNAGPLIHNFRFDESGQFITIEVADAYQSSQNSAPQAPTQLVWTIATNDLVLGLQNARSCPFFSYAAAHWTHGFGTMISWPGSTGRAKGIVTPLSDSCSAMNAGQYFLNAANGGLDTQSGDQHLSGSNSVNSGYGSPVFRDAYPTSNPYVLPTVPYNGEITAWQQPINISTVARSANVVTVTTSGAHNLQTGANVTLNGVGDSTYNGTGTGITVTGTTTFTFAQTGANSTSSGGYVDRPMMRFFHTWDAASRGFNSTPRGGVAQDGKKFCFVSDMQRNANGVQGTAAVGLGSLTGATSCTLGGSGNCRYDLYCGQLK